MKPTQDKYPVFEANQVLTNVHLNQAIQYLDEQERLTRANLIGIGIVCGLEIKLNASSSSLKLSKGCGVTTEGYLIVEAEDIELVSYRAGYQTPADPAYPAFADPVSKIQYPLWELFPEGEPDTIKLDAVANFLDDKAVLLFGELKREGLRNCSPNNCDDKGAAVTLTAKPLLIQKGNLDKVISEARKLETGLTYSNLAARLNLPDLRLPRYDVPASAPATSKQILAAFQAVFQTHALADKTGKALSAAYQAFKPVLLDAYPSDPFTGFGAQFGFLDTAPVSAAQVRFLPYYYDLFDDLLQAYDEFRGKGTELMCACCSAEGLFPRHLMLGLATAPDDGAYRHHFLASSAISRCEQEARELLQLFGRMKEMAGKFTNNPPLLGQVGNIDLQIRVTPSKRGLGPLSDKAIPYYYLQNGALPLFQLWNIEKTRLNRANQNLAYRSDTYVPAAPAFVTQALQYDLEPYNFMRIEGHLGKNCLGVMSTLMTLKSQYRLPIELVALHTGKPSSTLPAGIRQEAFQHFAEKHPGLQHKAGVPMGGTFAVVFHSPADNESNPGQDVLTTTVKNLGQEVVIADFFLPYRVAEADQCAPIVIRECEYEWIDSLRHLNNIGLREYRFTATAKARAAVESERNRLRDQYVIRIYKYEIQGQSQLSGGVVDIAIPLSELKAYKLSAVAKRLNQAFPLGLVFDHKPGTNKILMRRPEGHHFRLELGGLQGNQIRYAYDNESIYRWQKKGWEAIDSHPAYHVICRMLANGYQAQDYQWLHEKYEPKALVAAPGPSAKEAIEWEKLTLARARKYPKVSDLPIYDGVLVKIASTIGLIDPNAKVVLIGSWANGGWVSRYRHENLSSVANNGQWTKFLQLRQKVTGKTGHSDIELLVDSQIEITQEMLGLVTGYQINIQKGKKDAQKGLVLIGGDEI